MVSLYRKYRPKTFKEVVGQEHVVKTLTNALKMGLISHAYLFYGPRGSGKTTLARLLAKAVNCLSPKINGGFEPCNQCQNCLEINQGKAIDLIEIDAASNRGIDEIRALKEGIEIVPLKAKYKVYIIDEAHQLTKEASNALLKILEEPPKHAIFILCTTEFQKMLPTIISRCQKFEFKPLKLKEIVKKLQKIVSEEKIDIEEKAIELIAKMARGAMRDAESLFEEVINYKEGKITKGDVENLLGILDFGKISNFVSYLAKKDKEKCFEFLENLASEGGDLVRFFEMFLEYLHLIFLAKILPESLDEKELTHEEKEKIILQSKEFKEAELKEIIEKFTYLESILRFSQNPLLPIELTLFEIFEKS